MSRTIEVKFAQERLDELNATAKELLPADLIWLSVIELVVLLHGYEKAESADASDSAQAIRRYLDMPRGERDDQLLMDALALMPPPADSENEEHKHGLNDDDFRALTKAIRAADEAHQKSGGGTRHWLRECFFPYIEEAGFRIVRERPGRRHS